MLGDGSVHYSEGAIEINGRLWVSGGPDNKSRRKRKLSVIFDVVNLPIPLLIALNTLSAPKCQIHLVSES